MFCHKRTKNLSSNFCIGDCSIAQFNYSDNRSAQISCYYTSVYWHRILACLLGTFKSLDIMFKCFPIPEKYDNECYVRYRRYRIIQYTLFWQYWRLCWNSRVTCSDWLTSTRLQYCAICWVWKNHRRNKKTQLDLSRPLGLVPKCLPSFDAQSRMQNSIANHWFSYKVYFGCAHLRSDTGIASVVSIIFQKHLRPRFIFLSPEFCKEVILILFVDVVEVKIKYGCRFQNRISCR